MSIPSHKTGMQKTYRDCGRLIILWFGNRACGSQKKRVPKGNTVSTLNHPWGISSEKLRTGGHHLEDSYEVWFRRSVLCVRRRLLHKSGDYGSNTDSVAKLMLSVRTPNRAVGYPLVADTNSNAWFSESQMKSNRPLSLSWDSRVRLCVVKSLGCQYGNFCDGEITHVGESRWTPLARCTSITRLSLQNSSC